MTGGPDGISKIPDLHVGFFVCKSYYDYFKVLFIIGIICYLVVARIRKSYFGRALASVRDDEIAAKCMGITREIKGLEEFSMQKELFPMKGVITTVITPFTVIATA